jgi:DNA replication licensing factor MCM4
VRGIIIRCGSIVPEIKEAHFRCLNCNYRMNIPVHRARIDHPTECKHCRAKGTFDIVHNMSTFGDKQHVKMQESQENIPDGETPHHIQLCAFEEHVDFVRPGDRVEVVGIFRAQPVRVNQGRRNVRNIFTTYIDVVSYKKTDSSRMGIETEVGN